ncbi:MAG: FkbM family methyltransferase [Rhizomicrobium sp.]|jgi:FkbM family methyltransferase
MSIAQMIRRSARARAALALPIMARRRWIERHEKYYNDILDRLAATAVEDVVLRIDEFRGEFQLPPRSHLLRRILRHGCYEPAISSLFYSHIDKDRDIIDVGANVGFFTVGGAKSLANGRVLAVEPVSAAFQRLQRNVERNQVSKRVLFFNGLLSNEIGDCAINTVVGMEEYSSIGPLTHRWVAGQESRSTIVKMSRLDDLVSDYGLNPKLIKVDVEGAEQLVFSGAVETIKAYRPYVLSELSGPLAKQLGGSSMEVVNFFERLNYRVVDPLDPGARPGAREFCDIFCIPN